MPPSTAVRFAANQQDQAPGDVDPSKSRETSVNLLDAFGTPLPLHIETTTSDHATWITIGGEADASNHEQLQAELGAVDRDHTRDVHIRLADLRFCDARALSHLVVFAGEVRRNGGVVSVYEATPLVRKVTKVIDRERVLRLVGAPA